MFLKTLSAVTVAGLLATTGASAQMTQTQTSPGGRMPPPANAPAMSAPTAPGTMARPGTTMTTPPAAGTTTSAGKPGMGAKVNLNTATAAQLDSLPEVGKARASAIIAERTKGGPFKDWSDFDARTAHTSVNAGVKSKIKDLVTF